MYVASGTVFLENGTVFSGNSPDNLRLPGGTVYYKLPLPPGHWLPNAECRVYREPCAANPPDYDCKNNVDACGLEAQAEPNAINNLGYVSGPPYCQRATFIQPCDWETYPDLLGQQIYTLPSGIPIVDTFPYPCAAGVLGSTDPRYQTSALCELSLIHI